jgi:hypothetical protein
MQIYHFNSRDRLISAVVARTSERATALLARSRRHPMCGRR